MVRLVEVSKDNWLECINLPTSEEHRRFVAPNVKSIAGAQFYPEMKTRCIYSDDEMVGFTMYGPDGEDDSRFWIARIMISEIFRGKGYGRAALLLVLEEAKRLGFSKIGLSTEPDNSKAIHLYESVGFALSNEMNEGESVYICNITNNSIE